MRAGGAAIQRGEHGRGGSSERWGALWNWVLLQSRDQGDLVEEGVQGKGVRGRGRCMESGARYKRVQCKGGAEGCWRKMGQCWGGGMCRAWWALAEILAQHGAVTPSVLVGTAVPFVLVTSGV